MVSVKLLQDHDAILSDDWVRQLVFYQFGECMEFTMQHSGKPTNSPLWARVRDYAPHFSKDLTVEQFNSILGKHEFVRGEIPKSHREAYYE